jgi:hypothetical protein
MMYCLSSSKSWQKATTLGSLAHVNVLSFRICTECDAHLR